MTGARHVRSRPTSNAELQALIDLYNETQTNIIELLEFESSSIGNTFDEMVAAGLLTSEDALFTQMRTHADVTSLIAEQLHSQHDTWNVIMRNISNQAANRCPN